MRKFPAVLLGALALTLSMAVAAQAQIPQTCPYHWATTDVKIRHNVTNFFGYRDSSFFSQGTFAAETTATLPTKPFFRPDRAVFAASAMDSLDWLVLHVTPRKTPGFTAGGDSIYVFTQVSMDGITFINVTPTSSFQPANGLTTGRSVLSSASASPTVTSAYFALKIKQSFIETLGYGSAFEGTAPSSVQMFGWRYIRFIIYGDETGVFDASLDYISRSCTD